MILYILYSGILLFGKVSTFPHNGPASSYEEADSEFNGDHTFLDDHNWKLEPYLGDYYVPKINGEPIYIPPPVSHSQTGVLKPEKEKSPKGSLLSVYDDYVKQALLLEPTPDGKIGLHPKPTAQPIKVDAYTYLDSPEETLNSKEEKTRYDAFDQGSAMDPFTKENKEVNEVYADYGYDSKYDHNLEKTKLDAAKQQDKHEEKENQGYENYEYQSSNKMEKKTKQQEKMDKHSDKVDKGNEGYDVYNKHTVEKMYEQDAKEQQKEDEQDAKEQQKEDEQDAKQQQKEDEQDAKQQQQEDEQDAKQQQKEDEQDAKQQQKEDEQDAKQQQKEDEQDAKQQQKEDEQDAKQQQKEDEQKAKQQHEEDKQEAKQQHEEDKQEDKQQHKEDKQEAKQQQKEDKREDTAEEDSHSLSGALDSSLRSLAFHPKVQTVQRFQSCVTRGNETGVCMSVQHCSVPNIANSLEQWMNNVCVIEEAFIGVCCPEFPVESVKVEWDEAFEHVGNQELSRSDFKDCGLKQNGNPPSWPWLAPLLSLSTGNIFCGGVLITDLYVLTAAHCTTKIPNNKILVRLGQRDISDPGDSSGEDFAVVEIKRHAQYDRRTLQNDLALLKLSRRVPFDRFQGTVCLPNESNYVGNEATLIGWKGISGDSIKGRLLEETLTVMPNDECEDIQGFNVPNSQLCTEPRDEARTCNADSGAPLVLKVGNKYEVIGVLSWDRNDCDAKFPSVFTLVSYYNDWIKKHVQEY